MNTTTMSNVQFISVFQFITNLSITFNNKSLITIDQQNQTASVFNSLLHHLNASSNATEGRIQLLRQIREGTEEEMNAFDMRKVNETYKDIINEPLFNDYGKISGSLSGINEPNISALREIVSKDLSGNYFNSNVCSSEKANFSITPLAIIRLFEDYIQPFVQSQKRNLTDDVQTRIKRQQTTSDDDMEFITEEEDNIVNVETDSNSDIDVGGYEFMPNDSSSRGVMSIPYEEFGQATGYNFEDSLIILRNERILALKKDRKNWSKLREDLWRLGKTQWEEEIVGGLNLWCSETTNSWKIIRFLRSLTGKFFFFNDITLLAQTDNQLPWKIWRPHSFDSNDTYNIYYLCSASDSYGFVNLNNTKYFKNHYVVFSEVFFKVIDTVLLHMGSGISLIVSLKREHVDQRLSTVGQEWYSESIVKNKSKRMQSIEESADVISSIVPLHTFAITEYLLKGYILKTQHDIESTIDSQVPTYRQLANEYCDILEMPEGYQRWRIPNNRYIDDVFFEKNFHHEVNTTLWETIVERSEFGVRNWNTIREIYENSFQLQQILTVEDFFLLRWFIYDREAAIESKLLVQRAINSLALQQCDKESSNTPIKLYNIEYGIKTQNYEKIQENFSDFLMFSSNEMSVKDNLGQDVSHSLIYTRLYEIKFENQAGIADLDIITGIREGRFVLANSGPFEIISNDYKNFNGNIVNVVEMRDARTKEDKIVQMINELLL